MKRKLLIIITAFACTFGYTNGAKAQAGQALNFDGVDDYVNIPDNPLLSMTSGVTLACWIKTTGSPTAEQNIATKYDDSYYIGLNVGGAIGQVSFFINNVSGSWLFSNATNLNDDNWHYVACTYNGSTMSLYVDGALDNSFAGSGPIPTGNHDLTIGCRSLGRFFQGSIDDFSIWDHALTAPEVQNSYNNGITAPQTGLVAYYDFNEGVANANNTSVTTLNDASGNSLTGTLTNFDLTGGALSNWIAPGASPSSVPGAALNFDGVNDYVDCGNILPSSYTKEAWININDLSLNNNIISGGSAGQHAFWAPSAYSNQLAAGHNGNWNDVMDNVSLVANTWYHVAVTYDSASQTMNLYKNGALVSTNTAVPFYANGNVVYVGAYDPAANQFGGTIDEVRIWNRALCQSEIQNNMNAELHLPQTGLKAYYKFDQGISSANNSAITTALDSSGNGYNGTLANFALTGSTGNWVAPGAVTTGSYAPAFVKPVISVVNTATATICNGSTATLTASGNVTTYQWSNNGTSASVSVSPTVTTTYSVVGTNSVGCVSNTAVTTVTVDPAINTSSTASAILCNGGVATVTVAATGGTGTLSGTGTYTTTAGTYSYTVTDANGCSATSTITINQPTPLAATSTASAILCNGGVATVTVSAGGGTAAYTGTGTYTTTAGTQTYTVTDANSCAATTTVAVTQPAAITKTQSPTICSGQSFTVGTHTYTTANTYTDVLTSANGCDSTVTTILSVNATPTLSVNSATICLTQTTTLTASGATSYSWSPAADLSSNTGSSVVFTPTAAGNYSITVSGSDNGCSGTDVISDIVVNTCSSGLQSAKTNNISIYPNPAGEFFYVQANALSDNTTIEVYDMIGKQVISEKMNSNLSQVSLQNLSNGVYHVRIISNSTIVTEQKIIRAQ